MFAEQILVEVDDALVLLVLLRFLRAAAVLVYRVPAFLLSAVVGVLVLYALLERLHGQSAPRSQRIRADDVARLGAESNESDARVSTHVRDIRE